MQTAVRFLSAIGKPVEGLVIYPNDLVKEKNLTCGANVTITGPGDTQAANYTVEAIELRAEIPKDRYRDALIANLVFLRRLVPQSDKSVN